MEVSASILVLLTLRGHDYMLILRDPRTFNSQYVNLVKVYVRFRLDKV